GEMQSGVRSGNGQAVITLIPVPPRINSDLNSVRYIKDCINGNSVNTGNHWVELQAIYNGSNLAKGKTVTGTVAQNASYPYSKITDGDITSSNFAAASVDGLQCVTVDLGQTYNLDEIAIWHYYADQRRYYSNITYVSTDNSTWTTVISNTESETLGGKRVNAYRVPTLVPQFQPVTFYNNGLQPINFDLIDSSGYTGWYYTEEATRIHLQKVYGDWGARAVGNYSGVDLTGATKLRITLTKGGANFTIFAGYTKNVLSTWYTINTAQCYRYQSDTTVRTNYTYELDITGIGANAYVGIVYGAYNESSGDVYIYRIEVI
ncbi:MAG: discoidin domain-containing protein, partial [Clostridia bacterium]|nr:discoidin domain-containing protein [Clostridia bacterium]